MIIQNENNKNLRRYKAVDIPHEFLFLRFLMFPPGLGRFRTQDTLFCTCSNLDPRGEIAFSTPN